MCCAIAAICRASPFSLSWNASSKAESSRRTNSACSRPWVPDSPRSMCFSGAEGPQHLSGQLVSISATQLFVIGRGGALNIVLLVVGVMFVGFQRLLELFYSRRNERRLRA